MTSNLPDEDDPSDPWKLRVEIRLAKLETKQSVIISLLVGVVVLILGAKFL